MQLSDLHFAAKPNKINPFVRTESLRVKDWALSKHSEQRSLSLLGPSSYSPSLATHLSVYFERQQESGIDAVIVTGDLGTSGTDADLRAAHAYFFSARTTAVSSRWLSPQTRRIVADDDLPIIVFPGNHDRYNDRLCRPGSKQFENVFGPLWDTQQRITIDSEERVTATVIEKNGEHLAICAADFSLRRVRDQTGITNYPGQGRAHIDVLNSLADLTKRVRQKYSNTYVVWAVHFPPAMGGEFSNMKLIDGHLVTASAEKCKVNYILCGHIHEAKTYFSGPHGTVQVLCCGSATSVERGSDHSLYEFEIETAGGQLRNHTVRTTRYDRDRDTFRVHRTDILYQAAS